MLLDGEPQVTSEGYLKVMPRIARTGVQTYLASELGLRDRKPSDLIRVYRPESEVFAPDAMSSLAHLPVTVEHPMQGVDARNWKQVATGQTGGEVVRDGEYVRVPMVVMDAQAISQIRGGKVELSVGYSAIIEMTAGEENGIVYDAIQRKIRGNHLAIVDSARGGSNLRVFDSNPKQEKQMKKILIDGVEIEVSDAQYAIWKRYQDAQAAALADAQTQVAALTAQVTTLTTSVQAKDAEIVTLNQKVADAVMTPAKLDAAVAARTKVVDAAKIILSSVVVDGKTEAEIRTQVVMAKLGDAAKGWNETQIEASFNTLTASISPDMFQRSIAQQKPAQVTDGNTSYQSMCANLSEAWKGPKAA